MQRSLAGPAGPPALKPKRHPLPAKRAHTILIRERLVDVELAAAKLGIHEVGGNNRGPWMARFAAEVGLPAGYAWCDEFQSFEEHAAAGRKLPIESASVAQTLTLALERGWGVGHLDRALFPECAHLTIAQWKSWQATPARGDLGCVNWTAAGPPFADHIFLVVKAASLGSLWKLHTVEGNTSSGDAGSQGDGDGVYVRDRLIPKRQLAFVRIPGKTNA